MPWTWCCFPFWFPYFNALWKSALNFPDNQILLVSNKKDLTRGGNSGRAGAWGDRSSSIETHVTSILIWPQINLSTIT